MNTRPCVRRVRWIASSRPNSALLMPASSLPAENTAASYARHSRHKRNSGTFPPFVDRPSRNTIRHGPGTGEGMLAHSRWRETGRPLGGCDGLPRERLTVSGCLAGYEQALRLPRASEPSAAIGRDDMAEQSTLF